jgi:hypothetical protein
MAAPGRRRPIAHRGRLARHLPATRGRCDPWHAAGQRTPRRQRCGRSGRCPRARGGPASGSTGWPGPSGCAGRRAASSWCRAANFKSNRRHVLILNDVAWAIVEKRRGVQKEFLFSYAAPGHELGRVGTQNTAAFQKARRDVGLPLVRVHDLRHAFGQRRGV